MKSSAMEKANVISHLYNKATPRLPPRYYINLLHSIKQLYDWFL